MSDSLKILNSNFVDLIINADDFNISKNRNKGIIKLANLKKISSVSVLVNTLDRIYINNNNENIIYDEMNELIKNNISIGLHFNITEGYSLSKYSDKQIFIDNNSLLKNSNYEFHGKFDFYNLIKEGKIKDIDIKNELVLQITKFLEIYNFTPSHIDGHQHVHVIPQVASIINETICNFCIFKTRMPYEFNGLGIYNNDFYKNVLNNSIKSKSIFNNVKYSDYFIGIQLMGSEINQSKIQELMLKIYNDKSFNNNNKNSFINYKSVELMIHPGLSSNDIDKWDDFDSSKDREHELNIVNNLSLNECNLINYDELPLSNNELSTTIIVVGEFTYGTGNNITAQRIKSLLNKDFNVVLFNISLFNYNLKIINNNKNSINISEENKNKLQNKHFNSNVYIMSQFINIIKSNSIKLIYGVNLYRAGVFLNEYYHNCDLYKIDKDNIDYKIPYCLLIAGTDGNNFIYDDNKRPVIDKIVFNATSIAGLTNNLIHKVKHEYKDKQITLIPQSIDIDSKYKKINDFDILSYFNITNKNRKGFFISIIPSGVRPVKDPLFIVNMAKKLLKDSELKKKELLFIVIGAILDKNLYNKILEESKDIKKQFIILDTLPMNEFLNIMKNSDLVINCSINEGMSNCIIEALALGNILLVRNNEGNLSLIKDNENGFVFCNEEEFTSKFKYICNNIDTNATNSIIKKGIDLINKEYSYEKERQIYINYFNEVLKNSYYLIDYKDINNNNKVLEINTLSPVVHPFSIENNELFKSIKTKNINNNINILDIGCGWGAMSILYMLNNNNLLVNNLILSDINNMCLESSKVNINNYINNNCNNNKIKNVEYVQSYLLNDISIKNLSIKYNLIFANLPQSPGKTPYRSDKYGGLYGSSLYEEFFNQIINLIDNQTEVYFLHISICNPYNLSKVLSTLNLKEEIVCIQNRTAKKCDIDCYQEGLFDYWIYLKNKNYSDFQLLDDGLSLKYNVYLKRLTLLNS